VDVLSFEQPKMVLWQLKPVFFNQSLAETFSYRRKRSGHLFKDAVLVGTAGSLHNK